MRKKIVETATGRVTNVIVCDEDFKAPAGYELSDAGDAAPGDAIVDGKLIKTPPPAPAVKDENALIGEWLDRETYLKALISALNKVPAAVDHLAPNVGLTEAELVSKIAANIPK